MLPPALARRCGRPRGGAFPALIAASMVGLWGLGWVRIAAAQPESLPDGITIGDFWFRPSFQFRARGEYAHHPVDISTLAVPVSGGTPAASPGVTNRWVVHERTRFGLSVERGMLFGAFVLQDARIAGFASPAAVDRQDPSPGLALHAAFLEVRPPEGKGTFVRVGRQEVAWGDGRLLGISDWSLVPRSLDAIRARLTVRALDLDALGALLSPPGAVPPDYASQATAAGAIGDGAGAQLYGLAATLHLDPLLHAAFTGLARVARLPLPGALAPGDTFVTDGRVYGDRAGFTYAAEFAYEFGRFTAPGGRRRLAAWGATARVGWQSGWLFRPKFELQGSYASGDDGDPSGPSHRFDPILPDDRSGLGMMGIFAWSNLADVGLTASLFPLEDVLSITLGARHLRLADAAGSWFSASLVAIGQDPSNDQNLLGHELDLAVGLTPLPGLSFSTGYGGLVTGKGARAILGTDARLLSFAFVQAALKAP